MAATPLGGRAVMQNMARRSNGLAKPAPEFEGFIHFDRCSEFALLCQHLGTSCVNQKKALKACPFIKSLPEIFEKHNQVGIVFFLSSKPPVCVPPLCVLAVDCGEAFQWFLT